MELRSIGAYIGTLTFLALMIPRVQLQGFEENVCNYASDCSLGVTGCSLVRCDCPANESNYCAETDSCSPNCSLNKLNLTSCCDLIPPQFHTDEVVHVFHLEEYSNSTSDQTNGDVVSISVWTKLNDSARDDWKLLRVIIVNITDDADDIAVPSVISVADSLALNVTPDFGTTLQNLSETVPVATSLEDGLNRMKADKGCWKDLDCKRDIAVTCLCDQCRKVTTTNLPDESSKNISFPAGYYITDIGNHHAESIGVSTMLSAIHSPENSVNEWDGGTTGGWAPISTDTGMFMAFHNLQSDVCGIQIQGMAGSTYRSLELFKISVGNNTLVDEDGDDIVYKSGVMLDSTSVHHFPRPVPASSCLQLQVVQPVDASRVGFRAGLIGCSKQIPNSQGPQICDIVEEVTKLISTEFPEIEDSVVVSENPAGVSVALYNYIKKAFETVGVVEQEFKIKIHADKIQSDIYLHGVKTETLTSNGFFFSLEYENGDIDGDSSITTVSGTTSNSGVTTVSGTTIGNKTAIPTTRDVDHSDSVNRLNVTEETGHTRISGIKTNGTIAITKNGSTDIEHRGSTEVVFTDSPGSQGNEITPGSQGTTDANEEKREIVASVTVPSAVFQQLLSEIPPDEIVIISVVITEPSENATDVKLDEGEYTIGSSIIQINTFTRNGSYSFHSLNYSVVLRNFTNDSVPVCAFFQEEESDVLEPVVWKREGCFRVRDDEGLPTVLCHCNHSTSYAVLLQVGEANYSEIWEKMMSIVTMAGLTISMVSLTLALFIYFLLRANISSARYAIHSNLMVALLLSSIIFISPMLNTTSNALCYLCKYLLQYLIMATFCWMLAEGMHLYRQIITVFESERKHDWLYFVVGWGLPLLFVFVAISLTVTSPPRGSNNICFFSAEDRSIWFVVAPVLIIIVMNMVVLFRVTLIVVKAVKFQAEKEASETVMQVKAGLRSALLLMPLLGSTYILTLFTHFHVVIELIYNVINSLQGFFIALFYCALNTEVRNAINQYIRRSKDQSTIQGSTTGLKGASEPSKVKGMFGKNNKVSPNQTQFTFTTPSEGKLSNHSSDTLMPVD